jgi:putative ABC transport system ATP-binding protein
MGETKVIALNNVSMKIDKGEFLVILGPSGSGKSTLMHIASGLDRPDTGQVIWDKKNIAEFSNKKLAQLRNKRIGFVFQQFHLLKKANVLENVLLPIQYSNHEITKDDLKLKAKEILKKVNLADRIEHTPNQLSGGEQQRVAIARALINDPEIIFTDEPTGNLDSKTGKQILEILKQLNQERITIIAVTHDPQAAQYATRKIKIIDGKIDKNHA